jgi:hypothetical protein
MIAYARKTNNENFKDVLILDTPPKKAALIKVITDTVKIYPWAEIINLSTVIPEEADFTPNTRKSLTRKLKTKPIIKPVYDFLLKLHLKKQKNSEAKIIQNQLMGKGNVSEINILTQTGVNDVLFKLYPKASVNYFEHGQGDYFFIQNIKPYTYNFYCVFADKFKQYLQNREQENNYVKSLLSANDFPAIAKEVINTDAQQASIKAQLQVEGKLVLILMENVQIYNVPDTFWTDYLDLCIAQVDNPNEYTFILKPHPTQSLKSIEISKHYILNTCKLKALVIENKHAVNYSVEVLYSLWQDNTHYVFSVFSSALYYISKLYGNETTKYYYAYDFFKKYIGDAPPQFSSYFIDLDDLLRNVFSENCVYISNK